MASTPVFLPGESQGQRSLVGYSPSLQPGFSSLYSLLFAIIYIHPFVYCLSPFIRLESHSLHLGYCLARSGHSLCLWMSEWTNKWNLKQSPCLLLCPLWGSQRSTECGSWGWSQTIPGTELTPSRDPRSPARAANGQFQGWNGPELPKSLCSERAQKLLIRQNSKCNSLDFGAVSHSYTHTHTHTHTPHHTHTRPPLSV